MSENDYAVRHKAELQARWSKEAEIFRIQNMALKAVLMECPLPLRTPLDCVNCGNEACVKAYQEQQTLWGEDTEYTEYPAFRVNGTNTNSKPENLKSSAQSQLFQSSKQCPPPGQFVSGDLFSFVNNQPDEEAA